MNQQIRVPQVLLIDNEGNNRGLTDTPEALALAKAAKLDLVVVSPDQDVPVAKILDHGKQQYQSRKRQKQSARSQVKEVRLRPNVGDSDYQVRINKAIAWLERGDSVKFQVRLRGREHQHRDRATDLLNRVVEDLAKVSKVQTFDRRSLMVQVIPN
ncbi:MAG: translation initiation factor IF-3 [Cyanobacteria bacterium J06621_11]